MKKLSLSLLGVAGLLALTSCGVDLGKEISSSDFATKSGAAYTSYVAQSVANRIRIGHIKIKLRKITENASVGKLDRTYNLDSDVPEDITTWVKNLDENQKVAWEYFNANNVVVRYAEYQSYHGVKYYQKEDVSFSMVIQNENSRVIESKTYYDKTENTDQWDKNGNLIHAYDYFYEEDNALGEINVRKDSTEFSGEIKYVYPN